MYKVFYEATLKCEDCGTRPDCLRLVTPFIDEVFDTLLEAEAKRDDLISSAGDTPVDCRVYEVTI